MAGSATGSRHDERRPCRVVITDVSSFGLHAGATAIPATFWLIDAPDSLSAQSHRNPDGAGIGVFADGRPTVDEQPLAWRDPQFASEARELRGTTFLAHVRYGGRSSRANWCT